MTYLENLFTKQRIYMSVDEALFYLGEEAREEQNIISAWRLLEESGETGRRVYKHGTWENLYDY